MNPNNNNTSNKKAIPSYPYYRNKYNRECCSENTKFLLRIFCCPFYCLYQTFVCFWDNRCEIEPYYSSSCFVNNFALLIPSIIELVIVCIFK